MTSKARSEGGGRISGKMDVAMESWNMRHVKQGKKWQEGLSQSLVRVRLRQKQQGQMELQKVGEDR